ncbi:MAG: hypothetical protein KDA28_10740, partial [Phycisphaerales bacterium]|nr:hypothetical protein [Phycisphaerales bacterium]
LSEHAFQDVESDGSWGWGLIGAAATWEECSNRVLWSSMADDVHIAIDGLMKGDVLSEIEFAMESGRVTPTPTTSKVVEKVIASIQNGP